MSLGGGCSAVIGKAKSQVHIEVLLHPIAAAPSHIICRRPLRAVVRALTCFVRCLVSPLQGCFLVLSLNDIGRWFNTLSTLCVDVIGEAHCKEQFNIVHPRTFFKHMREVAAWLKERQRWHASSLGFSIHKDHKHVDRAGEAKKSSFNTMSMTNLSTSLTFPW